MPTYMNNKLVSFLMPSFHKLLYTSQAKRTPEETALANSSICHQQPWFHNQWGFSNWYVPNPMRSSKGYYLTPTCSIGMLQWKNPQHHHQWPHCHHFQREGMDAKIPAAEHRFVVLQQFATCWSHFDGQCNRHNLLLEGTTNNGGNTHRIVQQLPMQQTLKQKVPQQVPSHSSSM